MNRRYGWYWARFSQPDPTDSSYDLTDPQSFNRYAYTQNDPVNRTDPSGLTDKDNVVRLHADMAWFDSMGLSSNASVPYGNYGLSGHFHGPNNGFINLSPEMQEAEDHYATSVQYTMSLYWSLQSSGLSLSDAIALARKTLEDSNGDCAKLFSERNGLELLNKLSSKGKIKIQDTSVPRNYSPTGRLQDNPRIAGITQGGKVYLNPRSRVISGTYAPIVNGLYNDRTGLYNGFSPLQVLAATIIHELLHVSGDYPPETGQFAVEESLANNSEVVNTCFKKSAP